MQMTNTHTHTSACLCVALLFKGVFISIRFPLIFITLYRNTLQCFCFTFQCKCMCVCVCMWLCLYISLCFYGVIIMRGAFCVLILTVRTRNVSLCFAVCGATELHCSMLQTFQFATIIINIINNIINIKRHHHRYHIRAIGAADVRGKCVASVWHQHHLVLLLRRRGSGWAHKSLQC